MTTMNLNDFIVLLVAVAIVCWIAYGLFLIVKILADRLP